MSLEIVRQVSREHPDLLSMNLGRTCYMHTLILIDKLKAQGHDAYLVCKSPGEGQYTPPGFQRRTVTGLDGKEYQCSGVSHDAIWCDGKQFDTIASANEHDHPIYKKATEPFWSFDSNDGPQIVASPVWNEIAAHDWRANNPPLREGVSVPTPNPPTPTPTPPPSPPPVVVQPVLPGRAEMMHEGEWLDHYYASSAGLQRPEGLSKGGRPDWEGVGAWLFDVYLAARVAGKTREQARAEYVSKIRHSNEWREKHPGEQP